MAGFQGSVPAAWQKAMTVNAPGDYPVPGTITPRTLPIHNVPGAFAGGDNHAVLSANTTANASAPDPYAQYGGQTGYNHLVNNFNSQVQNVRDTSGLAGQNAYLGENTAISDKLAGWKNSQLDLDNQAVQNYLAKQSGNRGILDWVGQGVRSGGVMLANKNASNSSASDALARAYSQLGRQQQAGVNQQFANAQNEVSVGHQKLENEIQQNINDLPSWKSQTVNSIISQAQQQLGQIDQSMAYMNLPNRVNMQQEKQRISQNVLSHLQELDGALARAQKITPQAPEALQSQANQLFQSGTAPENAFSFNSNIPAQFQGTGPFASDLPLFTLPSKKQT